MVKARGQENFRSRRGSAFMRFDKKVPPPTSEGREGRLFPPEQSSKDADEVSELPCGRNRFLLSSRTGAANGPSLQR